MPQISEYDVIIMGGGPAGLAALFWCAEFELDAVLFERESECGGQMLRTYNPIANYLGVETIEARDLRDLFVHQVQARAANVRLNAEVEVLDAEAKELSLRNGDMYSASALVLATGVRRRRLGIPGEDEFRGRGILDSGVKSKSEVAGRTVLIVGGGDAAIENALILSETAKQVVVVHRRATFTARPEFMNEAGRAGNIEIIVNTRLAAIRGTNSVEAVELVDVDNGRTTDRRLDNVLIRIGTQPNTELFAGQLDLDGDGYVIAGPGQATSVSGVYAVGDVCNPIAPTVSSAVGDGAVAARFAAELIHRPREL